jgi:hypothetical protein
MSNDETKTAFDGVPAITVNAAAADSDGHYFPTMSRWLDKLGTTQRRGSMGFGGSTPPRDEI